MTRAHRIYGERSEHRVFEGIDVSEPCAGYFRARLVSGGIRGGVRIWHGPPHDPITGEELDRSWRWQAEFDGEPVDLDRVWPGCTGEPISEAEYETRVARARWAREHAPNSSYADPRKRRDPLSLSEPMPF